MAYTTHGHHIPGTIKHADNPGKVHRCGGIQLCGTCQAETIAWQIKQPSTEILVPLVMRVDDVPTKVGVVIIKDGALFGFQFYEGWTFLEPEDFLWTINNAIEEWRKHNA